MSQAQQQKAVRIGNFLGRPIHETIVSHGITYVFDRIARYIDGEFPLEQLDKEELLIRPGLIYRAAR